MIALTLLSEADKSQPSEWGALSVIRYPSSVIRHPLSVIRSLGARFDGWLHAKNTLGRCISLRTTSLIFG